MLLPGGASSVSCGCSMPLWSHPALGIVRPFVQLLWPISCHVRLCVPVLHEAVSRIKVAWPRGRAMTGGNGDISDVVAAVAASVSWSQPTHSLLLSGVLIWLQFYYAGPPRRKHFYKPSVKPLLIMGQRGRWMGSPLLFDCSWHALIKCAIHPCSLSLTHYGAEFRQGCLCMECQEKPAQ